MANDGSILDDVKAQLNIAADDPSFDQEVVIYINTAFSTLTQLGVGPAVGYMITDNTSKWEDFLGPTLLQNQVQSYIGLKVQMLFDPPTLSFLIAAREKIVEEMAYRINMSYEYRKGVELAPGQAFLWELTDGEFPPQANVGDVGIDILTGKVWRKTDG